MTSTDGLELVSFACPECEEMIVISEARDVKRVDEYAVKLTCNHCGKTISHDWPGLDPDRPAFSRMAPPKPEK